MAATAVAVQPEQARGESAHIPALDGIRGLAVLIVVVHHVAAFFHHVGPGLQPVFKMVVVNGWIGVDLFFVLSGFLITGILIRTKESPNRVPVFYARRALRIFPIYYFTLGAVLLAGRYSHWLTSLLPYTSRLDVAALLLYGQNWIPFWHHGDYAPNILGHFWSLGVEENFYFIWPFIIWSLPARLYLRACIVGIAISLALRFALVLHFGPGIWSYLMTFTGVDCLLTGGALAVLAYRFGRVPSRILVTMLAGGVAILGLVALHNYRELGHMNAGLFSYTVVISGYALIFGSLIGAAQYPRFMLTKWVSVDWLRRVGKYSYGIYVYHVPLFYLEYHLLFERNRYNPRLRFELLFLAAALVSTYLLAWASFEWFEKPIQRLKERFRPNLQTA